MSLIVTELYEALISAGAPEAQAKAAAGAIPIAERFASKDDIAEVRADMAELRTDIAASRAEAKADNAELRADIAASRAETSADIAELRIETRDAIAASRAEAKADNAALCKSVESMKLIVFRFLVPLQLLILGFLIRSAFFPN